MKRKSDLQLFLIIIAVLALFEASCKRNMDDASPASPNDDSLKHFTDSLVRAQDSIKKVQAYQDSLNRPADSATIARLSGIYYGMVHEHDTRFASYRDTLFSGSLIVVPWHKDSILLTLAYDTASTIFYMKCKAIYTDSYDLRSSNWYDNGYTFLPQADSVYFFESQTNGKSIGITHDFRGKK